MLGVELFQAKEEQVRLMQEVTSLRSQLDEEKEIVLRALKLKDMLVHSWCSGSVPWGRRSDPCEPSADPAKWAPRVGKGGVHTRVGAEANL